MADDTPDAGSPEPDRGVPPLPGALAFVGMGLSIAGCVAVGVVLGILVDRWLHTSPAFLVVGLVLGVGAAVSAVRAQVRTYL
jgi:F0F1-type ATP synthase assembly protein I